MQHKPAFIVDLAIQFMALAKRLRVEAEAGPAELRFGRDVHVKTLLNDAAALWGWAWVAANGEAVPEFVEALVARKKMHLHVEQQTSWVAADGR